MAGFIFSISSTTGNNGVTACINKGIFAAKVPSDLGSIMSRQVVSSVLCDYISMKPGDNVYFLSKRKIYGVGKLVAIGDTGSCVTKNYPSAHNLTSFITIPAEETPLDENDPTYRWMCYFQPEGQFFKKGVDMDDVLSYRPRTAAKIVREKRFVGRQSIPQDGMYLYASDSRQYSEAPINLVIRKSLLIQLSDMRYRITPAGFQRLK